MGVSPRIAAFLRQCGHDALHLREQGLHRLPDDQIVEKAAAERRVIVTFDLDFARILSLTRLVSPSIILFRLEEFTTDQLQIRLAAILDDCATPLIDGAIIVVEVDRVRIRSLPILS